MSNRGLFVGKLAGQVFKEKLGQIDAELKDLRNQQKQMAAQKEIEGTKRTPEAIQMNVEENISTGARPNIPRTDRRGWAEFDNARAKYLRVHNIPLSLIKENETRVVAGMQTVKFLDKKNALLRGFTQTITKNIDDIDTYMKGLKQSNSPLYNKLYNNFSLKVLTQSDSAEINKLGNALRIVAQEVANATSNPNMTGVVAESLQREVIDSLSKDQNFDVLRATLELYKKDLLNRVNASQTSQEEALMAMKKAFPKSMTNFQGWSKEPLEVLPYPGPNAPLVVGRYYKSDNGRVGVAQLVNGKAKVVKVDE